MPENPVRRFRLADKMKVSIKKKIIFSFFTVFLFLFIAAAFYALSVFQRSRDLYGCVKPNSRGWRGMVHKADPELGFASIPNSQGAHIFPRGPDIPMRYDATGFRVPVEDKPERGPFQLSLIALGCSFTYGDAVYAEDTFSYLAGQSLGASVHNAGVGSYGLSQMLILARKWIPVYQPAYTLVQYSPWLTDRATRPFAPTYVGKLPGPYFFDSGNEFKMHSPVFLSNEFSLPFDRYRNRPSNVVQKVSFLKNVSLPFFAHQDIHMFFYAIRRLLGIVPEGSARHDELVKYVYSEISKIVEKNHSKMVIVILGRNSKPVPIRRELFPKNAILIEAHDQLLELLPHPNDTAYSEAYAHWRGDPPVIVDGHPNETAHRIIAEEITKGIKEAEAAKFWGH